MKVKYNTSGSPDFKNDQGLWSKGWSVSTETSYTFHHTRGSGVWSSINRRSKTGNGVHATYEDVENGFESFQDLVGWAVDQHGYMCKDTNGKFWQLDKDLLYRGNKIYSKEFCLFVPHRVNCVLTTRQAERGDYPLGVYLESKVGKFRANCQQGTGIPKFLGYFDDPMKAHKAWQQEKIKRLVELSEDTTLGEKLQKALVSASLRILRDIEDSKETKCI